MVPNQRVGEAVYLSAKSGIGEVANAVVSGNPAQGKLVRAARLQMAVDRLVSNVEAAPGKPVK